jgi:hypothetical protein
VRVQIEFLTGGNLGPCAQCGSPIEEACYQIVNGGKFVRIHHGCMDAWSTDMITMPKASWDESPQATPKTYYPEYRGKCLQCGEDVLGGCFIVVGLGPIHNECHEAWRKAHFVSIGIPASGDASGTTDTESLQNAIAEKLAEKQEPEQEETWRDRAPLL